MDARRALILENCRLQRLQLVPEIQLYLADELIPLWRLIEEKSGERDVPPPFWAFAWPGGQAIARYLIDRPEVVIGKHVLDFATGSGLCAVAAMRAGAASAVASDIDMFAQVAVGLNADANGVKVVFDARDLLDDEPPPAGLILTGDICYEARSAGSVRVWLQAAHARGTRVLIGDPGREYFHRNGLVQLAGYQVPTSREVEDATVKPTGVFTFPS